MSFTVDPPMVLPVTNLSVSSLKLLANCPEQWHRKYILGEYLPPSGKMLLGSCAGAATTQHFAQVIDTGEGYTLEQVEDEFSTEWEDRVAREEVSWQGEDPGELKDSGIRALDAFHSTIIPKIVPVSVEREFLLNWPGIEWGFQGFFDLEEQLVDEFGEVIGVGVGDTKFGKKRSQWDADFDWQPSSYLYGRRAEGNPAPRFRFHVAVRTVKKPYAETVTTTRTNRQLDAFADRVFLAAQEIAWRAETETWSGAAPGAWMCSPKYCGYWSSCKFGGAR